MYYDYSPSEADYDYSVSEADYDNSESEADYDYTMTGCPGSLRECLDACSPVVRINPAAYKICVNECLERC